MISYLSSLSPFCFGIVIIIHYIKIKRKSFCFFLIFIFFFCIYSNFCIIFRYFYYKVLESKVFCPFDTRLLRLSDLLALVSLYRIKDKLKKALCSYCISAQTMNTMHFIVQGYKTGLHNAFFSFIYEINGFCRMISKSESDDRRTLPIRQVLPDLRFP